MSKQFTLGKKERLKSRKLIEQLFSEGKNFAINPYRVYYIHTPPTIDNSLFTIQFGVGVSSKNFKKAADRNRIKRITRGAYRLQKTTLQNKLKEKNVSLNIFFIYTSKEIASYKDVYDKMNLILTSVDKMMDEIK